MAGADVGHCCKKHCNSPKLAAICDDRTDLDRGSALCLFPLIEDVHLASEQTFQYKVLQSSSEAIALVKSEARRLETFATIDFRRRHRQTMSIVQRMSA